MRFQDAAQDARAVTYAAIQAEPVVAQAAGLLADASPTQRVLARAVMNGETLDPDGWRTMFPTLFGPAVESSARERSEAVLTVSLAIADRGDETRNQLRGALVESLTAELLGRRIGAAGVRRERRILFDGVRGEIHPYDVTVERSGAAEAYDCKWGARGDRRRVLRSTTRTTHRMTAMDFAIEPLFTLPPEATPDAFTSDGHGITFLELADDWLQLFWDGQAGEPFDGLPATGPGCRGSLARIGGHVARQPMRTPHVEKSHYMSEAGSAGSQVASRKKKRTARDRRFPPRC